MVTDAEVLQEILHRYLAIKRPDAIQPALDTLLNLADEVLPVDRTVIERAKTNRPQLSAASLLAAQRIWVVMQQHEITQILSSDSGFDGFSSVTRLP